MSSFKDLEDARGSWLESGILILIWIWSLVFDTTMIQILALYLDFEGAKNIQESIIWFSVWLKNLLFDVVYL